MTRPIGAGKHIFRRSSSLDTNTLPRSQVGVYVHVAALYYPIVWGGGLASALSVDDGILSLVRRTRQRRHSFYSMS